MGNGGQTEIRFIGAGNMAQAMIGGILAKEIVKKEEYYRISRYTKDYR